MILSLGCAMFCISIKGRNMKKYTIFAAVLALTGCNTYHNSKHAMTLQSDVETPLQSKVEVGSKVTGTATCNSFLYVINSTPERQTYLPSSNFDQNAIGGNKCVAGALYDALSKSSADIIISPQYTTMRKGFLCFGERCMIGQSQVIVTGYAGKITSIKSKI